MFARTQGTVVGNTVVLEDEQIAVFEGKRVMVTIDDYEIRPAHDKRSAFEELNKRLVHLPLEDDKSILDEARDKKYANFN